MRITILLHWWMWILQNTEGKLIIEPLKRTVQYLIGLMLAYITSDGTSF